MWQLIGIAYLLIGVVLVVFTRARDVIKESSSDVNTLTAPAWKVALFHAIIYVAATLLWPVFIPSWFFKPRTAWDALNENPLFQERKALFEAMSLMSEDGVDTDVLPNGNGEYGMTASNPIPCKTILGSTTYLRQLRRDSGAEVVYERLGSTGSDVSDHPVDIYEVAYPNGEKIATLYISPYQKRNSRIAPRGFKLLDM